MRCYGLGSIIAEGNEWVDKIIASALQTMEKRWYQVIYVCFVLT